MKKRLLYLALALFGAPLLWGQSQVVCTTASPGTVIGSCASGVVSPVTTDPVSATGVWTFDNAANTPVTFSDGATVKAGTGTGTLSVGGVLCKGAPAQATTGTSEEILATCTIPANTLSANGSALVVRAVGVTAANGNNKTFSVRVGGIGGAIVLTAATSLNNRVWALDQRIMRTGATSAVVWSNNAASFISAVKGGSSTVAGVNYMHDAVAITWANANDLVITGTTPTAAGDLTLDSYSVEVVQ